jgi:HEAT repeat protein
MRMTPLAVFFKTLSRTSAIFIGTAIMFLHPPLEWGTARSLSATKGPRQATIDSLVGAMRDPDASVRREVARALEAYAVIDAQRAAVAELTAQLSSPDVVTRTRAACQLRDIGSEAQPAMNALVELLSDDAPVPQSVCGERWRRGDSPWPTSPGEQAAAALTKLGDQTIDPLLRTLKHTAPAARRNAAWALGALDATRAVTALTAALKDSEASVREQVAWALGAIGDAAAVPALISALKDDAAKVREQAAWALGAIGDNRAMDPLLPLLKDADAGVRRQAAWALGVVTR